MNSTGNDDRAPATIMNTVKLLAIVVVTVAVTLLCIRSGQAMAKTLAPAGAVRRPPDGEPEVTGPHKLSATTANNATVPKYVTEFGATDTFTDTSGNNITTRTDNNAPTRAAKGRHVTTNPSFTRRPVQKATDVPSVELNTEKLPSVASNVSAPAAVKERTNQSAVAEHAPQASSRSLGTFGRHAIGPLVTKSGSREPPLMGNSIKTIPFPVNHRNDRTRAADDDEDDGDGDSVNNADIIVDTGIYRVDNRPDNMYRQTGHLHGYSTVDADVSVAEEDGSTGYQNSYDSTGGGHQPSSYNPTRGVLGRPPYGSAAASPAYPYQAHPHPSYTAPGYSRPMPMRPQRVNGYYGPPQTNGYGYGHQHVVQQPYGGQTEQYTVNSNLQHIQMIYDKIDWQKVGILALFKVGLAKLKAFGFLKILFLLVFKLKMFLIAMFFKFLLIMKLMKFFKLLMIPMVLLMLMPLMSSLASPMLVGGLLSIPQRIIQYLTEPVYAPAAATAATKYSTSVDPVTLPGTSSAKTTGNSGGSSSVSAASTAVKPDETYSSLGIRRLDSLKMIDPSLNVFQRVLESEKCVERIACRMAVVEKVGILPMWINWVLHRVSKYISNEKLQSYLKTYDDVNDELYSKMETTDNWAKWCFDRYDCNNINNTTNYRILNVTDPKQ